MLKTTSEQRPPVYKDHFRFLPSRHTIYNAPTNRDHLCSKTRGQSKSFPNANFYPKQRQLLLWIAQMITINLLHAEVSFIIDTTCHWTFLSNITSYFLERQNHEFFDFPTPNFRFLVPSNLHWLRAFFDVNNKSYRHAGKLCWVHKRVSYIDLRKRREKHALISAVFRMYKQCAISDISKFNNFGLLSFHIHEKGEWCHRLAISNYWYLEVFCLVPWTLR